MARGKLVVTVAALFAVTLMVTPLPSGGARSPSSFSATAAASGGTAGLLNASAEAPATAASPAAVAPNAAALAANRTLAAVRSAGLPARLAFVPRPSASPNQVAATQAGWPVVPLYGSTPAPLGLAYYGLSEGSNGSVVGRVFNTTRVMGIVDANATGIQPLDLVQSAPDSFGIQLNSVLTNVTLFGRSGFSFWAQNVVEYSPATGRVVLITNVWNFSSYFARISGNAIYANGASVSDGPNGTGNYGALGFYYGEEVLNSSFSYPFNLSLYLNSTVVGGRDAVEFGISLSGPSASFASSAWDYVVFNSVANGGPPLSTPSNFTADGLHYDNLGLTNDFELDVGGPGGGSQATLFAADATLGLAYYNGSAFVPVPAAYNYGGETGETAIGASTGWSTGPSGPAGLSVYGTMFTGPTTLRGLWNASSPAGSVPLTIDVTPSNAFTLVVPVGAAPNFTSARPSIAPIGFGHTYYLTPGLYSVTEELADYEQVTVVVNLTSPYTLTLNLLLDTPAGVYTPLWAFSNAQVANLAIGGSGTPSDPYRMPSDQPANLPGVFGLQNDYGFPVYPGVFFYGTNASVEFLRPPSLAASVVHPYYTVTTVLPMWFWNCSDVSIVNATKLSATYPYYADYPTAFNPFAVIFYEGGHNLLANDTFACAAQCLLMYSGGTFFGPAHVGGGNNTVWGSRFSETGAGSFPHGQGLGIELAESNDLVYNNLLATPTTAWQLPVNLYTDAPELFSDAWNITRQPATVVRYASGFPTVPLSGSVVNTTYQGGNSWWDYGNLFNRFNGASNPYDRLPYNEDGPTPLQVLLGHPVYHASFIAPGGDFVPLVGQLYGVTLQTSIPTRGNHWYYSVYQPGVTYATNYTNASVQTFPLPNGTYYLRVYGTYPNFTYEGVFGGAFNVSGSNETLNLTFLHIATFPVTFQATPAVQGMGWSILVRNLSGGYFGGYSFRPSLTVYLPNGSYSASPFSYVYGDAYLGSPLSFNVSGANLTVSVPFTTFCPAFCRVSFVARGLAVGTPWTLTIDGANASVYGQNQTLNTTNASVAVFLPAGNYTYSVAPIPGYQGTQASGALHLRGHSSVRLRFEQVRYPVTFREYGLPALSHWKIAIGATVHGTSGNTVRFNLPNGTYDYAIATKPGWTAAYVGTITVDGAGANVSTVFVRTTYLVAVHETGLPNGTYWIAQFGPSVGSSFAPSPVSFHSVNGTYRYRVYNPPGFVASGQTGTATVDGGRVDVYVSFAPAVGG